MASVELRKAKKQYGSAVVIPELDLEVRSGEFMVLVGPSGCGKSTLLRMVAGLEDISGGTVAIDGKVVNDLSPKARNVAMVFQNYALYPHMTVRENLAFALKLSKMPATEIDRRVAEAASTLGLTEHLAKKPGHLSGGQKQRVAMGRAMVRRPSVFLFDEPLSNLDAQLRVKMRSEISLLHRSQKATTLYVTHDQVEAMTLADRIAVLYQGKLEQLGTPLEVYNDPATQFVASFIGTPSMNFLPAPAFPKELLPAEANLVGFRPEKTQLSAATVSGKIALGTGKVMLVELLGTVAHVHLQLGVHTVVSEMRTEDAPKVEEGIGVYTDPKSLFYFDTSGRRVRA
jgi:ABC-type sugar transport system ATPase subunit